MRIYRLGQSASWEVKTQPTPIGRHRRHQLIDLDPEGIQSLSKRPKSGDATNRKYAELAHQTLVMPVASELDRKNGIEPIDTEFIRPLFCAHGWRSEQG